MVYCWVTEDDYAAFGQVAGGQECGEIPNETTLSPPQLAAAQDAVAVATSVLQVMSGRRIHGPGIAVDEFRVARGTKRLKLTHQPVTTLSELEHLTDCGVATVDISQCTYMFGGALYFNPVRTYTFDTWARQLNLACGSGQGIARVKYLYGSTVTPAARNAMLTLAHEFYLAGPCGDSSECSLPERVTSVTRDGVSYTMLDPQSFYDQGRIGVPIVDQWLSSLKYGGTSVSGVYGSDSPPGVNISVKCRPAMVGTP